ncbi:polymer-forming cytoskeletal protein [Marimonas sp. MJW-29]|uniref:Polymer-forming cytoskeletal protein n=1 Tax=Sulfitobacter sediminis TaxID=3234186 RepID=A0ABV3RT57_9RHOB
MTSVIEEELTLEGNITSKEGTVEVKGKVLGNVVAASVVLHQRGAIDGALTATSVSLEGSYQGSLKCEDLRVASTATVKGDVSSRTMTTESGAKLVGKVNIGG